MYDDYPPLLVPVVTTSGRGRMGFLALVYKKSGKKRGAKAVEKPPRRPGKRKD